MNPRLRHATLATVLLLLVFTVHAKTASEVYEQAARSTVVVENIDAQGKAQSMGSGVVLGNGNVVTNCHVVKGASRLKVRIADKEHPATLRYSDWERDVCSLSSPGLSAPAAVVGNTKTLKVGAKVYAIGAPKGLNLTLSDGIVSSLREVEGGHYIQTTAAISPGSSGGGLFDENGALIGLTTFYLAEGQNLNFAVPVEWVNELAQRSTKASATEQPVTQWLNKAIELEARKDWPALIEHSRHWTKAQPGIGHAWFYLGSAYDMAGQPLKAIDAYQQALRFYPENVPLWNLLGHAYKDAGQSAKAIDAFQQAQRINPEDYYSWQGLGMAYGKAGQPLKAVDAHQQAVRINPEAARAWGYLGTAYAKVGQLGKAMDAYQQAVRIDPEDADAWFYLGSAYMVNDQPTKAIDAYQQALRINPENAKAWHFLGLVYGMEAQHIVGWKAQPIKAIDAYEHSVRINSDDARAWFNLGFLYAKVGQPAKAIDAYEHSVRINPEAADAWNNLGVAYAQSGQRGKVLDVYKRLKTLDPALAERFFNKVVMP